MKKPKKLTQSQRIEKIQMLKLYDEFYTQKKTAQQLGVSRNTIVNDEREMRKSTVQWGDAMSAGDFLVHVKKYFAINSLRILDFDKRILDLGKVTPKDHDLLMSILQPLLDSLPDDRKKDVKFAFKILAMYGDENKAERQAGALTLYQNTITNMMNFNSKLITGYPMLRTTIEYTAFLNSRAGYRKYGQDDDRFQLDFMKLDKAPNMPSD